MRVFLTLPLLLCLLAAPDQARSRQATPSLAVGDPAPPLRVEAFLKGEPIAAFEPGKVYVIEFWATWCAPCIEQMPHLSALQTLYADRGVTIVGTDSSRASTSAAASSTRRSRSRSAPSRPPTRRSRRAWPRP